MEMRLIRIYLIISGLVLMLISTQGMSAGQVGELVPPHPVNRPVSPGLVPDLLYFEKTHSLNVGDKGEDRFDISTKMPACGATALVFDYAQIVYKRQRFGEAKIINRPPAGCLRCPPLVVRWYHEPTGHLDYQVHVYRRRIEGNCPKGTP